MKKKMLPLAVSAAAAVSMSASAQMYVDNGGLGEVLSSLSTRLRTAIPLTSTWLIPRRMVKP